ncbi:sensor histidine kinase, partial [Arsenicibacter rosenii]
MKYSLCALQHSYKLLLLLILIYSRGLYAQIDTENPPFRFKIQHFGAEDGLPNRNVLAMGQDHQGFVWLGTLNGAYQYDGNQFKPPLKLNKLPKGEYYSREVSRVGLDRNGNLWLGSYTDTGPQCGKKYLLKAGQIQPKTFKEVFHKEDPFKNDCIKYYVRSESNIFNYLVTHVGNIYWHSGQGDFRKIGDVDNSGQNPCAPTLFETRQKTLLVSQRITGSSKGCTLFELDSTGKILQKFTLSDFFAPVWKSYDGTIYLCRVSGDKSYLLSSNFKSNNIFYKLNKKGDVSAFSAQIDTSISKLIANDPFFYYKSFYVYDSRNELFWFGYEKKLIAWHPKLGTVFNSQEIIMPEINSFSGVMIDKTGAIWIRTENGVILITLENRQFNRYLYTDKKLNSDSKKYTTRGMVQIGDKLIVNTHQILIVDIKSGKHQPLFKSKDSLRFFSGQQCPLLYDRNGSLWCAHNALSKIELSSLNLYAYNLASKSGICTTILPFNKEWFWLGHHYGLSRFNVKEKKVYPYTAYNQFDELSRNIINGFFPDQHAGGIWVPASSGLYLLDTLKGVIARYSTREKSPAFLPFDHFTFIHPDRIHKQVYWLATLGGGLIRWNRKSGEYKQYTTKDGLSDNTIYAIYEDKLGRLWLPSNNGLMSFQKDTHQLSIYHVGDGIADDEFNLFSHYQAPDGRLFLGGINGITAFYPDQIPVDTEVKSPLLLTVFQKLDMNTGNMVDYTSEYKENNHIHLTSGDRLFSLTFTLLDFRYLHDFRLWYRIEGWQDKWVMQNSREIRINGLPAGNYTLQVKAQINNGKWVTKHIDIPVYVDAPFYFRLWFILLCVMLCISLGILLSHLRNQQLQKDKELLEYEVSVRTEKIAKDKALIEQQANQLKVNAMLKSRFLANVSHEFRTPLTLIIGPIKYIAQKVTDSSSLQLLAAMERNAEQLLLLVNDLLSLSKTDSQQLTLNEQPVDLALLVKQTVIDTFLPQAQYAGIDLQVTGVDEPCLMLLDGEKLITVIRNLISNSLRFTQKGGRIEIHLSEDDKTAKIEVKDTGAGIHPDDLPHIFDRYFQTNQLDKSLQGGTGIGLAICREYCSLWGGAIAVVSEQGKGSTFFVTYPKRSLAATNEELAKVNNSTLKTQTSHVTLEPVYSSLVEVSAQPELRRTLLLVDDNPDVLLYLKTILSPAFRLIFARNGNEALTLL